MPAARVAGTSSAQAFGTFLAWTTGLETHAAGQNGQLAVNHHWAPIFARCATTTVAVQDTLMLRQQKMFLRDHAQQVLRLQALAAADIGAVTARR